MFRSTDPRASSYPVLVACSLVASELRNCSMRPQSSLDSGGYFCNLDMRSLIWQQRKAIQLGSSLYMTTSQYMIPASSSAAELAF